MRRDPRARPSRGTAAAALLALMLAGCGQRGPLSLPDSASPDDGAPADAGDAADSDEDETGNGDDER